MESISILDYADNADYDIRDYAVLLLKGNKSEDSILS
jgi:hypothetical protein